MHPFHELYFKAEYMSSNHTDRNKRNKGIIGIQNFKRHFALLSVQTTLSLFRRAMIAIIYPRHDVISLGIITPFVMLTLLSPASKLLSNWI